VRAAFDARFETPLPDQNILNGPIMDSLGINGERVVAPHEVDKSMMFTRMNSLDSIKMPPIAKDALDSDALAALRDFINYYPTVSFDNASSSVSEAAGTVALTVSLNTPVQKNVTVQYQAAGGTAQAGKDFMSVSGTLTFAPNTLKQQIFVPVIDDATNEPDKTFVVSLSSAVNATITGNSAQTITILNDDAPPQIHFASAASQYSENAGVVEIPVQLSAPSAYLVSVSYSVAGGSATNGPDFSLNNGQLSFAPGETEKRIQLSISTDAIDEPSETLIIALSNPVNAMLGAATHTLTIKDGAGPILRSPLSALPSPAHVGDEVIFSSEVESASLLQWQWFFGDGLQDNSPSSSRHIFTNAGDYAVSVIATDPNQNSATSSLTLTVLPLPNPITPPPELLVKKLSGSVSFARVARDSCQISGSFTASGQTIAGANFSVSIGGASAQFTLDSKGRARSPAGTVTLRRLKYSDTISVAIKLARGNFANAWKTSGLIPGPADKTLELPIEVQLDATSCQARVNVRYRARNPLAGRFTIQR
jgi:hypothetical protein